MKIIGNIFFLLLFLVLMGCETKPKEDTQSRDLLLLFSQTGSQTTSSNASFTVTSATPLRSTRNTTVTVNGTNLRSQSLALGFNPESSNFGCGVNNSVVELSQTVNWNSGSSDTQGTLTVPEFTSVSNGRSRNLCLIVGGTNIRSLGMYVSPNLSILNIIAEQNVTSVSRDTYVENIGTVPQNAVFSVSPALPSGLSIGSNNGRITGTPSTTTGNSVISYTVTGIMNQESSASLSGRFDMLVVSAAEKTNRTCNTEGTSAGCTASLPFSCANSTLCFSSISNCRAATSCGYSGF